MFMFISLLRSSEVCCLVWNSFFFIDFCCCTVQFLLLHCSIFVVALFDFVVALFDVVVVAQFDFCGGCICLLFIKMCDS